MGVAVGSGVPVGVGTGVGVMTGVGVGVAGDVGEALGMIDGDTDADGEAVADDDGAAPVVGCRIPLTASANATPIVTAAIATAAARTSRIGDRVMYAQASPIDFTDQPPFVTGCADRMASPCGATAGPPTGAEGRQSFRPSRLGMRHADADAAAGATASSVGGGSNAAAVM